MHKGKCENLHFINKIITQYMSLRKGFTLIELLVVIAIIGLLSSVVLASLNTARNKGSDAAIKQNLAGIRPQAEIYYDGTGASSYGTAVAGTANCLNTAGTLFADVTIYAQIQAAVAAGGSAVSGCASTAGANGTWAVAIPLKSNNATAWCVDSRGIAKLVNSGAGAYVRATIDADVAGGVCGA